MVSIDVKYAKLGVFVNTWNSEGMEGVTHFGISEGKGGLKYGSCLSLCMDIYWNCPLDIVNLLCKLQWYSEW